MGHYNFVMYKECIDGISEAHGANKADKGGHSVIILSTEK